MDKETNEMFEILHNNKILVQKEERKKRYMKQLKKSKRNKNIITVILLILIMALCVIAIGSSNKEFIEDCTRGGISENVCRIKA